VFDIIFNGEKMTLSQEITLLEFLKIQKYELQSFAVAVDETFIPRHQYGDIILKAGNHIEVVTAMQGG